MKADTKPFQDELLETTAAIDMRSHPFVAALAKGVLPRDALRRYTIDLYLLAYFFPQRLAALAAMCDDAEARAELLRNLLEEDGIVGIDGERLIRDPERSHGAIARRLCLAAGATDDDLDRARAAYRRDTWVDRSIASGALAAALAYLTVGIEGCVAATFPLLLPMLEQQYGFSRHDLEFVALHATADAKHARIGAALTASVVRSDDDRAAALEGAARAATAWWWWHRSFVR